MVSLWPWKGEDNSAASFEKTLSSLATKIATSQSQLDSLRQRGRRLKALFTLYTTLAYLLCLIISFLVIGWPNWTIVEYTALSGSPVLIYLVRTAITSYYNYRVDTVTQRLEGQQAERTKTIEKLKSATKYDSTQQLLEKYGGAAPKPKKSSAPIPPKVEKPQSGRTSMGPPLTANILRPGQVQIPSQPSTPQPVGPSRIPQHVVPLASPVTPQKSSANAEFAPNAYSAPSQYAHGAEVNAGGNWYDRVLDLLLGEDETLPKNRVALICQNCRLVNGQAPPGTKSLADLGKWRCFGCGSMNGVDDEAEKAVEEMKQLVKDTKDESVEEKERDGKAELTSGDDSIVEVTKDESTEGPESLDSAEDDPGFEVKSKRGRPKGSGKKSMKAI